MTFLTAPFLILFLTAISTVFSFDPSAVNYCKRPCRDPITHTKIEHVACDCRLRSPREMHTDNMLQFRQHILDFHNHWRDVVASGKAADRNKLVTSAANMMVINYDLEMEYYATCLAGKFDSHHDGCRHDRKNAPSGQNLAGSSERNDSLDDMMIGWYDEIDYIDSEQILLSVVIHTNSGEVIGHFTQLIWATTNLVGCARVWNPSSEVKGWSYGLICDYGSRNGPGSQISNKPIYQQGEPCSACPFDTKCETSKYPALCGKSEAPPDTPAFSLSPSSDTIPGPNLSLVCILYVFYFIKLFV